MFRCSGCSMTVVFEEEEPVPTSPGSGKWIVKVNEVEETPRGSRRVLRSVSYRFKTAAAAGETDEQRERRLEVKRKSKLRAMQKFEPQEQQAARKAKRRRNRVAASHSPSPPAPPLPLASLGPLRAEVVPGHAGAALPPDITGETTALRDLAILRAFRRSSSYEAALLAVREQGLDDPDEPWSVARVQVRHFFLRRYVSLSAGLVRAIGGAHGLSELASRPV